MTYSTGLARFHLFCDELKVPWTARAPTPEYLISAFLATLAGSYSTSTIRNYISGLRAWHLIHSLPWFGNSHEIQSLLKGARLLQPAKRPPRLPIHIHDINRIMKHLHLQDPFHTAVFACLTTTFFSCSRLGEFTVLRLRDFSSQLHITIANVSVKTDILLQPVTVFFLPSTKTAPQGEEVQWKKQDAPCDPEAALSNHIVINKPKTDEHLFTYSYKKSRRPLTRNAFLTCLRNVAQEAQVSFTFGHSLRIGGTLEYLLRGIPFEVVKQQGRWKSDSFSIYLRNHAQIIGPYLSNKPELHDQYLQATQPIRKQAPFIGGSRR